MKTRKSALSPLKSKPHSPVTKRRGQFRNETLTSKCSEKKRKIKKKSFQLLLQKETQDERALRLQRHRDDKLKRRAAETEEKMLERRRLEAEYMKNRRHNETPEQRMRRLTQRKKHYREKKEKEEKNVPGNEHSQRTAKHRKSSLNISLPDESTLKIPVQKCTVTYGTRIKKVTKFDVVSNLLYAICKKQHSQCKNVQQNQAKLFKDLTTTLDPNNILATIFWRKYSNQIKDNSLNRSNYF